ncbi:nuclear pore complex protein An-Nup84 [Aspergillus campestris IBT 28561]|uniref:Nuclear pore complex protein n=1 Tax=Aspergillus campestris (strain IBT 28561) TaxID=1392248 RepID=A0A2I1DGN8_ASPC2|nr:nuclear pore complex protein An-Nup84 [Aspergillus campestris IBT 28561]PKY09037.1 nuclear pore complex protein An-Nup84 [Aspergillus campestris IBT 28561]
MDDDQQDFDDDEEMEEDQEEEVSEDDAPMDGSESPLDLGTVPNGHNGYDMETPQLFTSAGAQQALHPLRRTADRVTRQIEAFAEKLDRFKQQGNRSDDFQNYQAAYQLVKSYQTFAQDAINDITKQDTLKRAKMGWSSSLSNGSPARDPKTDEELQRLQLEANTWQLLLNLISIGDPPSRARSKQAQETAFQKLHRYSSDREVWERFLEADHYAMECVIAMKWLERTSRSAVLDIDSVIHELETQAERGQNLWTNGWLYTKETIKGHKRLRAWPQPLEPNDPSITASLLSTEKSQPLITQLDPDAVVRQKQGLQKQDQFYERATWMTCWKMLRQGEDWTKIREWSRERLECWRAVSLCGSSVDKHAHEERTPVDDGTTRMMNCRSQEAWRAACSALARNPNNEDFERAVYGLLCGETEAAFKVCQSWDDYLYVYFNSVVLSRYRGFCTQLQRKLSHSPTTPVAFVPEAAGYAEFNKFVQYTRGNQRIGVEARNPYRTIQAAILGKGYDSFFHSLAKAVSHLANSRAPADTFIPELPSAALDDSLLIAAEDRDALRIASHLYILASALGFVRSDSHFVELVSVNVMGYIADLEDAGIYDMIPLYASILPTAQAHSVLGQVLIDILDPAERMQQVRLMKKYRIDVEAVLQDQWRWISSSVSSVDHSRTLRGYPKVVRRKDGTRELVPVKKDFIGTEISSGDERLIRSLEWLRYVDGQWGRICQLGALLYRKFYIAGKLSAARELSRRMRLSDISQESFGFDLTEFPVVEDEVEPLSPEPTSPTKARMLGSHKRNQSSLNGAPPGDQTNTNLLVQQAQGMLDLEQLILALDALEHFAYVCDKTDKPKHRRDSGAIKDLRGELQDALDEIGMHIDSMLDDWLIVGENDAEQAELDEIRTTYIPEVFLDYHSALYYSGHILSSDILVQCMNLAMQVSENEYLTRSFVESQRMAELVDALALSSKAMVNTGAQPGKRLLGGESLGIWNVQVSENEDGGEE